MVAGYQGGGKKSVDAVTPGVDKTRGAGPEGQDPHFPGERLTGPGRASLGETASCVGLYGWADECMRSAMQDGVSMCRARAVSGRRRSREWECVEARRGIRIMAVVGRCEAHGNFESVVAERPRNSV